MDENTKIFLTALFRNIKWDKKSFDRIGIEMMGVLGSVWKGEEETLKSQMGWKIWELYKEVENEVDDLK